MRPPPAPVREHRELRTVNPPPGSCPSAPSLVPKGIPMSTVSRWLRGPWANPIASGLLIVVAAIISLSAGRSEEHTSELQSRGHLVCRLLLEKKKKNNRHRD